MSNHLAIATVSAALGRLIQTGLDADVPGATVTHDRPGGAGDDKRHGVTIFLYQVTPNVALRSADLPGRDASGHLVRRPAVALDLHYLLTCFGNASTFEPERIIASISRQLHERASLDPKLIKAAVEDAQNAATLANSDLGSAPERVRLSPVSLNLEELSKLWSVLFQTSYRLSVAYRASVVQIESRTDATGGVPVRRRGSFVLPLNTAEIFDVRAAAGAMKPIQLGDRIVVTGRNLNLGELTLNGIVAAPTLVTESRIELELAPASLGGASLPAGVVTACIRLPAPPGAPAHLARETAAFPFLLRPQVTPGTVTAGPPDADGLRDGSITVVLNPGLRKGQQARLLLDSTARRPIVSAVLAPVIPEGAAFPLSALTFSFTNLPAGSYLLRVQVDGSESAMAVADNPADAEHGNVIGPRVVIP
jgi:hypothetical protein